MHGVLFFWFMTARSFITSSAASVSTEYVVVSVPAKPALIPANGV
jgi:hypothetical protein